jgi:hypothetical protein
MRRRLSFAITVALSLAGAGMALSGLVSAPGGGLGNIFAAGGGAGTGGVAGKLAEVLGRRGRNPGELMDRSHTRRGLPTQKPRRQRSTLQTRKP